VKRAIAVGAATAMAATTLVGAAPASAAPRAAVAAAAAPAVAWGSCPTGYPATLQCAKVRVPLDYGKPNGTKLSIVISRAKATGTAAQRQGVLLVNPGGPGGPGVGLAAAVQGALPGALQQAYDVIGFDPRGVGLSGPILCVDPAVFYKAPLPDPVPRSKRDLVVNTARSAKYAKGCVSRNGPSVRHYNTINTARDMDQIRSALGERKINYLGYSYGTFLGAVYASMFPERARRFVLDSAVDPKGIWYDDNLDQNVAFDLVFREFLRWVADNEEVYDLGDSYAEVRRAWYRMRAQVKRAPAGGVVGPAELDNIFIGAMYYDGAWPGVAQAFSDYVHGDPTTLVEQFSPADEGYENGNAVYTVVECNDAPWPRNLGRWFSDANRQYRKYPLLTWSNLWLNLPCAFWPFSAHKAPKVGGKNLPGILVVNSTGDPATPYAGAVSMSRSLPGSRLLTVTRNTNHGQYLFEANACVDAHGSAYLLSGTLPARGARCVGNPHPVPEAAAATAAAKAAGVAKLPTRYRPGRVR
jgi:pimeloyl-ACP methyl ester carboxylesterase